MNTLGTAGIAFDVLVAAGNASAQTYPAKPIRPVVPYRGVAPALTDLMGGHSQLVMTSLPPATGQVQAGRLAAELARALQSSDLIQRFAAEGVEPSAMTRKQFTGFIANEITRWRKVALDARIRPE